MIQTHLIDSPQEADAYLATLLNNGATLPEIQGHAIQKIPDAGIREHFLKSAERMVGKEAT